MTTAVRRDYTFSPLRVKAIRVELGLSQEEFAAKLGVRTNSVSRWECGRGMPRRARVLKALMQAEWEAFGE